MGSMPGSARGGQVRDRAYGCLDRMALRRIDRFQCGYGNQEHVEVLPPGELIQLRRFGRHRIALPQSGAGQGIELLPDATQTAAPAVQFLAFPAAPRRVCGTPDTARAALERALDVRLADPPPRQGFQLDSAADHAIAQAFEFRIARQALGQQRVTARLQRTADGVQFGAQHAACGCRHGRASARQGVQHGLRVAQFGQRTALLLEAAIQALGTHAQSAIGQGQRCARTAQRFARLVDAGMMGATATRQLGEAAIKLGHGKSAQRCAGRR